MTKGNAIVTEESQGAKELLQQGKHLCFLAKETTLSIKAKDGDCQAVVVAIGADVLAGLLPAAHPFAKFDLDAPIFHYACYNSTKKAESLAQYLAKNTRNDFLGQIFERAKILELLAEQLSCLVHTPPLHALSQSNVSKIEAVKQLIEQNTEQSFSLAALAKLAGTNQQYLKTRFKMLYGTTVFKYMISCKMDRSKMLIAQNQMPISEIAQAVGYKHHTHFTHAFKRHFGFLPKVAKIAG